MSQNIWLNERHLQEAFLTSIAAERKEKLAKRFSLKHPTVRPYARIARLITVSLLPGLINKKGHPQTDKRFFCDFRLGVAVMLACGYPYSTEADMQVIEEGAYRLAQKRDWLQYMSRHDGKHSPQPQHLPQEEFRELIATLSDRERKLAEATVLGREKQKQIAQDLQQSQAETSKQLHDLIDRFAEMELERNRRQFPLFYSQEK